MKVSQCFLPWTTHASSLSSQTQPASPAILDKQFFGGSVNLQISQLQWSSQKHVSMPLNVPYGQPLSGILGIDFLLIVVSIDINQDILTRLTPQYKLCIDNEHRLRIYTCVIDTYLCRFIIRIGREYSCCFY